MGWEGAGSPAPLYGPASMPGHQFCCLGHAQTPEETDFGGYEMTRSVPTLGKSKRCRCSGVPGGEQG